MKDVTQLLISVSSDGAILTFWLLLINQKEIFKFYKYELKKKKISPMSVDEHEWSYTSYHMSNIKCLYWLWSLKRHQYLVVLQPQSTDKKYHRSVYADTYRSFSLPLFFTVNSKRFYWFENECQSKMEMEEYFSKSFEIREQ